MLWRLFSSDKRVAKALEQSTGVDISPNVLAISEAANNDEKPAKPLPQLWLEDWSEKDEARLRRFETEDSYWDGVAYGS